jgi:Peptidase family M23
MRELTYFPLLVRYPVTSGYGYRIDPITGAQGKFHRGVDYGAPHGAPVIAPYDGHVTTGYESGGAGNWLWVDDGNGNVFKSFHHASNAVSSGWVEAGRELAYIDSTGSSTGSHAHLELWDHGVNIDPTGYLNRAPLRDGSQESDEMTDEDFARIQQMFTDTLNNALAKNYTGQRGVCVESDPGLYELVIKDGVLGRRHIGSPAQLPMLQRADYMAGDGSTPARKLTNPDDVREFLALPVFADD